MKSNNRFNTNLVPLLIAVLVFLGLILLCDLASPHTSLVFIWLPASRDMHAIATVRIEKVDAVDGEASGKVDVELFPITYTKVISVQFEIQSRREQGDVSGGRLVVQSELFELLHPSPDSNYVRGTAGIKWDLGAQSTPGTRFPFDQYQLVLSKASLIIYSQSGTAYPVDQVYVEIYAPNMAGTADGMQLSNDNLSERIITLRRPWIMWVLFATYVLLAAGQVVALLGVAKTESLATGILGLTSLFVAREALTRGVSIFPTLVDYLLAIAFLSAGLAYIYRVLFEKPKKTDPPAH